MNYFEHAENKIKLYEQLKHFEISKDKIKGPIAINNSLLQSVSDTFKKHIDHQTEGGLKRSDLDEFKNNFINHYEVFAPLRNYKGAAVYWFEIKSKYSQQEFSNIIDAVKNVRTEGRTPSQAKKANRTLNTKNLYVGKVKTANTFFTRIVSHLGLWNKRTGSLQLLFWMPKFKNLELSLYYYEIPEEYVDLIDDIEYVLWKQKLPLLGSI